MSLGITADDAALASFNGFKDNRDKMYVIFNISGSHIVVESDKGKDASYDDFISAIKESGDPRFAVVNVEDGSGSEKIVFVAWPPDLSSGRLKMTYASSREEFVQSLEGVQLKLQATDDGELTVDELMRLAKCDV
ncbi:hypothetical protein FOZ61_009129 [Perkinsus olseni]|uniref:ADF-H domain-containing protein n=1 Tax=Perkinsus olseni TaxID=32597 RepID=A0A7J6L0X6_PEROL|nr:hypothetical protein FOZ61_009129 [Perkinsus olseni]